MARPLLEDTIDAVANRVAAGEDNATIGQALGITRSALSGIIFRLRRRGDSRVPPAGRTAARTKVEQRDALAEAFAYGASECSEAAAVAGLPIAIAHQRWSEVRAMLGWQAQ